MEIDNNYTLENDSNQWTLIYKEQQGINEKTGKPITTVRRWYCSSLTNALKRYFDESLKPSKDIQELKQLIDQSIEKIKKATA